jgi:membrane-associated phospholipid phosphatase
MPEQCLPEFCVSAERGRAAVAGSVVLVLSLLAPLVALVGCERGRVGAHTVAQAIVATILAVIIIVVTFSGIVVPVALPAGT